LLQGLEYIDDHGCVNNELVSIPKDNIHTYKIRMTLWGYNLCKRWKCPRTPVSLPSAGGWRFFWAAMLQGLP
jgi:hypothetical protein